MLQSISEPVCLDELIARYGVRRGRERGVQPAVATGHAGLDACLPGGALTEIVPRPLGSGELSLLINFTFFHYAGFQPSSYQTDDSRITDSVFNKAQQPLMIKAAKEVLQIGL